MKEKNENSSKKSARFLFLSPSPSLSPPPTPSAAPSSFSSASSTTLFSISFSLRRFCLSHTTLFKWRQWGCRYKLRPRRRREVVGNMIYFCYGGGVVSADLQWEKWGCRCVERGQRRSEVRTADGGNSGGQRVWMKKLLEVERYTGERGRSSGPSSFF